jgi:hypothetical protein
MLSGDVEIDETYIGGKHLHKYGYSKKQAIFGAVERNGMAKAKHVKSTGVRVLIPEVTSSVAPESNVFSDEWSAYKSLSILYINSV